LLSSSSHLCSIANLALHRGKILYLSLSVFFAGLVNHWFGRRVFDVINNNCGDEVNSSVAHSMSSMQASSYYFSVVCG
jgi:hypothetical protein